MTEEEARAFIVTAGGVEMAEARRIVEGMRVATKKKVAIVVTLTTGMRLRLIKPFYGNKIKVHVLSNEA